MKIRGFGLQLFSNKIKSAENIHLDESGEIIRNEKEVANVFQISYQILWV